jgi:cyclopropane-fatty-acyl-phospholipid synthase
MSSISIGQDIQQYLPVVGDISTKSPLAYAATRGIVNTANAAQMALAEAYINGLEVPDSVVRSLLDTFMPICFKSLPSLLVPYEWVLKETDHLAEGARELMKIQYDLPQAMLNRMLGNGKLIYPKYSMGLWEKGAADLEQSQMHMIDDLIEKLDIQDGDNILDFGCGWGCIPNYVMSKFPKIRFTGVNLSHEQCEYMRQKMHDPESYLSSGRFTLVEGDLNEVQLSEKFDKILSVGVFCHVGNLTNAFQKLASCLKPDGKVFIHIITARTPTNVFSAYLHKYIFPHARIWNFDAVPNRNQDLKTVKRWYLNGVNYSRTLTAWFDNFDRSQDWIKDLNYGMEYAKFRRIWRLYLMWVIADFNSCGGEILGNGQFLMVSAQ